MAKVRAHLWISGLVQGVSYRYYMSVMAEHYGVAGWARNSFDGRVEAMVEGEESDVKRLIDWCRAGPPAAEVENVDVEHGSYTGEFTGFHVRA